MRSIKPVIAKSQPFLKKHVKNAKDLENIRRRQVVIATLQSWIIPEEKLPEEVLEKIVKGMEQLMIQMEFKEDFSEILLSALVYGTRVVNSKGHITSDQVMNHLALGLLLATKMLEDEGIDLDFVSAILELSKKHICRMERQFLQALDYNLYIPQQQLDILKLYQQLPQITKSPVIPTIPSIPIQTVAAP